MLYISFILLFMQFEIWQSSTNDKPREEFLMRTKMPFILCKRIIMLTLLGCMAQSLQAATLTVTNASNSGSGSLRATLANANDGDTVVFARSLKNNTIMLPGSSQLNIDKNITLNGDVDGDKKPDITINGVGRVRLFKIGGGAEVTLKSLNLLRGSATREGGGILNDGTLTISKCTFNGNWVAAGSGGAISNRGTLTISESTFIDNESYGVILVSTGGAIMNRGTATISKSTFNYNLSDGYGGAISNARRGTLTISESTFNGNDAVSGGAISNRGTLTVSESTFIYNTSGDFGGGAIENHLGTLTISRSSFNRNAGSSGGVIKNWGADPKSPGVGSVHIRQSTFKSNFAGHDGGVIFNSGGKVLISASTLAYNTADDGSAVFAVAEGTTVMHSSTLYGNKSRADHGGTVQAYGKNGAKSRVSLANTVIAGSTGRNCVVEGTAFTFTTDHSWFDDDSCPNGDASGTDSGDPELGALRDNGGYTETMMPSGQSGLIDAGNSKTCTALDQRQAPRVGTCDIGSVEYGSKAPPRTLTVTNDAGSGRGSLRATLAAAHDGDTIVFDPSIKNHVILLSGAGQITIDKSVVIDGDIDDDHKPDITISGTGEDNTRLLRVNPGKTVTLAGLILENGRADYGGAILNAATLTINDCRLHNNTATNNTVAVSVGVTDDDYGAVVTYNYGGGATVVNSALSSAEIDNSAGGAIYNEASGILTISNTTLDHNTSTVYGGAIYNNGGVVTLVNATLSGNDASKGAGLSNRWGHLTLKNTTVYNTTGEGIYTQDEGNSGTTLINTVIAGSTYANCGGEGTYAAIGNNWFDDDSCVGSSSGDPKLDALSTESGWALSMPASDSGLVDAGDDDTCLTTDARGYRRPHGAHCDIGAVEFGATAPSTPSTSSTSTTDGAGSAGESSLLPHGPPDREPAYPCPGGVGRGCGFSFAASHGERSEGW